MTIGRLYFIYQQGCGACAAAKPVLAAWAQRHPEWDVRMADIMQVDWKHPWKVRATPTYVFEVPGRERVMYVGAIRDIYAFEDFLRQAKQKMGLT